VVRQLPMSVDVTSVYPVAVRQGRIPEGLSSSLPNKLNGAIDRRLPGRAVAIAALGWRLRTETRLIYRFEKTVESSTLQTFWDPAAAGPLPGCLADAGRQRDWLGTQIATRAKIWIRKAPAPCRKA
jgi:hypothetical protein